MPRKKQAVTGIKWSDVFMLNYITLAILTKLKGMLKK